MKLYIVRGLPGSGKSTTVNQLYRASFDYIFSTDEYWIRPDGVYDFNFKLLNEAHKWNFSRFLDTISYYDLDKDIGNIFIDNTNIKLSDFEKYINAFLSSGGTKVVLLEANAPWRNDPEQCARRNTHNVPLETIEKMQKRWESSWTIKAQLEDYYNNIDVSVE